MTTARAFPNIALVKYWGKRDEQLMLPAAGSISLTIDAYPTTTTVQLSDHLTHDVFVLNGVTQTGEPLVRVARFLALVREHASAHRYARVSSDNQIPTGAGLASSAAGFAALAVAASDAYGLQLDRAALSRLARRGSGSAARSLIDGMSVWHAGSDDSSSVAEPITAPELRMIIVTLNTQRKSVSSRTAMRRTALTSPFYSAWVRSSEQSLQAMLQACRDHDFSRIGRITETHALRMHALIQSADPPIRYLSPASVAVFDAVAELRDAGLEIYATADAGPNIAVIAQPETAEQAAQALAAYGSVRVVSAGSGARRIDPAMPANHTQPQSMAQAAHD